MSGPVASVLLPNPFTALDQASLHGLIDAVSDHDLGKPPALDRFWVCDTRFIGGEHYGGGRPFAVETGLSSSWEQHQLGEVAEAFGFTPRDEIVIIAFCHRREDHRILGELCLRLAERFAGVVNFGGALWPPVPLEAAINISHADWRQVDPYFCRMVAGMPGRVLGLRYEPQPGREWVSHLGDAAFLRAWLNHPNFKMVK